MLLVRAVPDRSPSFVMGEMIRWIRYFAVLVKYWDDKVNHVATRFLAMPVCNIATAEKMFEALNEVMEENIIPWENVVGYTSDTANVMVGARNSVLSRIRDNLRFSVWGVCVTWLTCVVLLL